MLSKLLNANKKEGKKAKILWVIMSLSSRILLDINCTRDMAINVMYALKCKRK